MFRKLIHITVALLLLFVTAGYSISKHYCGTRLVSVTISHEAEPCCDMEGKSGCCRNETKSFQLDENFVISPALENNLVNSVDLLFPLFYVIRENILFGDTKLTYQIPESPPPIKRQTALSSLQTYLC